MVYKHSRVPVSLQCSSVGDPDLGTKTTHQSRRERQGRTVSQVKWCYGHKRAALRTPEQAHRYPASASYGDHLCAKGGWYVRVYWYRLERHQT